MPQDRLLSTVLQAYQSSPDPQHTPRIISSTTSLLTTLSNPLNISLLVSHLLASPAVWNQADGLHTSLRMISSFNTAAITVRKNQLEGQAKPHDAYQPRLGGGMGCDEWTRAVVKGLDERSSRWQHTLVLTGVMIGMEGQQRRALSTSLKNTLENAIVTATNLGSQTPGIPGANSIVLALTYSFQLLSDRAKKGLDYDTLLPFMISCLTSDEGYENGNFLREVNKDVGQVMGSMFKWSENSASYGQLQRLASKPLISCMGPLSRLIAHAIENSSSPQQVVDTREQLVIFSGSILQQWQRNKLSEIDVSEEALYLAPETLQITLPMLWQILKSAMFAIVVILRAITARTLIDPILSSGASMMASQTLLTLRNIHFISSRLGSNTFSAYTFVNFASIDILSKSPRQAAALLRTMCPSPTDRIPSYPLQRNLDLFYLNTVEHFTHTLPLTECEILAVAPCLPYLSPYGNSNLLEIFEAAHSAILSVFSAPQNTNLTARVIPLYIKNLFLSFPANLSPRQFRFAFKTLIRISTPPSPLAISHPMMAETLLEVLHHRACAAPTSPLAFKVSNIEAQQTPVPLSEQTVLLLTLLDALPNVPLDMLELWLCKSAELLNIIQDPSLQEHCRRHFWEILENGEMDVERSAVCVGWWGTHGGRKSVLQATIEPFMSGGLGTKDCRL